MLFGFQILSSLKLYSPHSQYLRYAEYYTERKLKDALLHHCAKENTGILIMESNVPIHKGSMDSGPILNYYTGALE